MHRNRFLTVPAGIVATAAALVILQVIVMRVLVAQHPAGTETIVQDATSALTPVGPSQDEPLVSSSTPMSSGRGVSSAGGAIGLGLLISVPIAVALIGVIHWRTFPRQRPPDPPDHDFYVQAYEFGHGHPPPDDGMTPLSALSCRAWPRCTSGTRSD